MGFFQDLKKDLSQTVSDLEEETVNGIDFDSVDDLSDVVSSSEDLFGTAERDFADLEAMLEKEVEALNSDPLVNLDESTIKTSIEKDVPILEGEPEQEPVDYEEQADQESEVLEQTIAAEAEIPTEQQNINVKSEANDMEMEQLLNGAEQNGEEPEFMDNLEDDKAKADKSVATSTDTAIITEGMHITGDVSSSGNMDLLGSITGNIDIVGKLNVTGSITGNSSASEIYAESARINGEIKSKGSVKIGQSSVVIGNIFATSAVIAGAVKGDIDVHGPVILDASAIVMGNIKSKSVQIKNGAVIEGMCSQCYAEINPAAFFDDFKNNKK